MATRRTLAVIAVVGLLCAASIATISLYYLYSGSQGSSISCGGAQCTSQTVYHSTEVTTSTATTTITVPSTVVTTTTVTARTTSTITVTSTATSTATTALESANAYSINFNSFANGSEPSGWTYDPTWSVNDGQYQSVGSTGYTVAYYTGATFSNLRYSDMATGLSSCNQSPPVLGMMFDMKDRLDGYSFWGDIDKIQIVKWVGGISTVLVSQEIGQIPPTGTFAMSVATDGNNITANWNGQYTVSVLDSTYSSGYIGLETYNCGAGFNDISVNSTQASRAGIYVAVSQTDYPYGYSSAQDFVNAYSQSGLFATILLYAQSDGSSSPPDFTRTLQIAAAADSIPNFKMIVDIGFDIGSSSDWSTVKSFVSQLATYPSVGWVGIEGEHTTYTGCEFGGSCPSIGQAWNNGTLSESQLEAYYAQFDNMVTGDGLQVAHYYLTFGSPTWQATQQAVWVTQWPVCSGSPDTPCDPLANQLYELSAGTSPNYIGISGGLSTNEFDAWNPTVSGSGCGCDNVISTYIQYAEQQPYGTRQLVLFETGAYNYIPDWTRSIFTTDLANAMAEYPTGWIYPGAVPSNVTATAST